MEAFGLWLKKEKSLNMKSFGNIDVYNISRLKDCNMS